MEEDERRRRMCSGKIRHKDQTAAEQAIRSAEWADERGAASLRSYRCEYCGRWHLTSQSPR